MGVQRREPRSATLLALVLSLAILIKTAATLLVYTFSIASGGIGLSPIAAGGDDGVYYVESARGLLEGGLPSIPTFFSYVVAFFFGAFGENILLIRLVNLGGSTALLLLLLLLARKILPAEASTSQTLVPLALLVSLYPSLLLFESISIYRDVWIALLYVLCVTLTVMVRCVPLYYSKVILIAVFVLSLGALGLFRWYAAMSVVFALLTWRLLSWLRVKPRHTIRWTLFIAMSGVITLTMWQPAALVPLLSFRDQYEATGAGSNLGLSFTDLSLPFIPFVYLYSVFSNIFGPLPWQLSGLLGVLLMVAELPLLLVVAVTLFRRRMLLTRIEWYLVLHAVVWFFLIGFFNDNVGTAARLRIPGWLLLMVLFVTLSVRARSHRIRQHVEQRIAV